MPYYVALWVPPCRGCIFHSTNLRPRVLWNSDRMHSVLSARVVLVLSGIRFKRLSCGRFGDGIASQLSKLKNYNVMYTCTHFLRPLQSSEGSKAAHALHVLLNSSYDVRKALKCYYSSTDECMYGSTIVQILKSSPVLELPTDSQRCEKRGTCTCTCTCSTAIIYERRSTLHVRI